MNIWHGKPICGGIAIGTASVYRKNDEGIEKKYAENKEEERKKYTQVKSLAIDELDSLFDRAKSEIGENEAQIFSIHKLMLQDMYYNESVLNIIEKQKMNAETAVLMTSKNFESMFRNLDSAYMRERASDIRDISDRMVALLKGKARVLPSTSKENTIIFASNLAPSETLQMDKSKIVAFVTEAGSTTSHTAILARSMGIPAVAGIKMNGNIDGKRVAIDGYTGTVYIEPDEKVLESLAKTAREKGAGQKKCEPVTKSGKRIKLFANISEPSEVKSIKDGCDGIGIFGSEFLYSGGDTFPSELYQFDAYRKVIEAAKEVSIRTLDIGADKKGTFFGIFREENDAMGMRAIRLCLKYPNIFKTQLRAILRASVCGRVKILLPMVVSCDEIFKAKRIFDEAKAELTAEKTEFDKNIPIGVVIETPAAAIISDDLAKVCDFFMVDADNLAQHTLAMDRKNLVLSELFDRRHKAVMKLIEISAKNAQKNKIPVRLCGEILSDSDKIPELLKMGITEFSVSPQNLKRVSGAICESE